VVLRAIAPCAPTANCIAATASSPEGLPVHAEDCVVVRIEAPRAGLELRKAFVGPAHVPLVGDLVQFELVVRNTGNTTLMTVEVVDTYDTACLKYVNAVPAPDSVNLATGEIRWNNVGPLAPGDVKTLSVFLATIGVCQPAVNCAQALAPVPGALPLLDRDCVELPIRAVSQETPTPTATLPPGQPTPTLTATRPPSEATPTATRVSGMPGSYLPIAMKAYPRALILCSDGSRVGGPVP